MSNMSSDHSSDGSDSDDSSYLNTKLILKGIKRKIENDFNVSSDMEENDLYDIKETNITSNEPTPVLINQPVSVKNVEYELRSCSSNKPNECILLSDSELDVTPVLINQPVSVQNVEHELICSSSKPNESILLSDSEFDVTPESVISKIDNALHKRKPVSKKKKNQTRQRKQNTGKSTFKQLNGPVIHINDSEDVNNEIPVKVWWKNHEVIKFTLKRYENMKVIYEYFSKLENISENDLLFLIQDKIISRSDTPDLLNINAATIIDGGILKKKSHAKGLNNANKNEIQLKVQLKDRKQCLDVTMKYTDTMNVLMCQCADKLNVLKGELKFYFDGELIRSSDTAGSLQLETGDCIDCTKLKK